MCVDLDILWTVATAQVPSIQRGVAEIAAEIDLADDS